MKWKIQSSINLIEIGKMTFCDWWLFVELKTFLTDIWRLKQYLEMILV